jgi:hypothetical protein
MVSIPASHKFKVYSSPRESGGKVSPNISKLYYGIVDSKIFYWEVLGKSVTVRDLTNRHTRKWESCEHKIPR